MLGAHLKCPQVEGRTSSSDCKAFLPLLKVLPAVGSDGHRSYYSQDGGQSDQCRIWYDEWYPSRAKLS